MLISAARDGHLEVVRTLLSKYADVEAADIVSSRNWNIFEWQFIQITVVAFFFKAFACNGAA